MHAPVAVGQAQAAQPQSVAETMAAAMALAVEAESGELAPLLVNSYLEIKQKSQL